MDSTFADFDDDFDLNEQLLLEADEINELTSLYDGVHPDTDPPVIPEPQKAPEKQLDSLEQNASLSALPTSSDLGRDALEVGLFGKVSGMLNEIELETARAIEKNVRLHEEMLEREAKSVEETDPVEPADEIHKHPQLGKPRPPRPLWVQKHDAKSYNELIADPTLLKEIHRWFATWVPCVFHRPMTIQPRPLNPFFQRRDWKQGQFRDNRNLNPIQQNYRKSFTSRGAAYTPSVSKAGGFYGNYKKKVEQYSERQKPAGTDTSSGPAPSGRYTQLNQSFGNRSSANQNTPSAPPTTTSSTHSTPKSTEESPDEPKIEYEKLLGEDGRPLQKIALFSGPPGTGKSTTAHFLAKHAGYRVVEVNTADEKTRATLSQTIRDAVGSTSLSFFSKGHEDVSKPVCVIIEDLDAFAEETDAGVVQQLVNLVNGTTRHASKSKHDKTKPAKKGPKQESGKLSVEKASKPSEDKAKSAPLISRPIVAICNDQFRPAIRPLLAVSRHFQFRPSLASSVLPSAHQNVNTAKQKMNEREALKFLERVCRKENCPFDAAEAQMSLQMHNGDLRAVLNQAQLEGGIGRKKWEEQQKRRAEREKEGESGEGRTKRGLDEFSPKAPKRSPLPPVSRDTVQLSSVATEENSFSLIPLSTKLHKTRKQSFQERLNRIVHDGERTLETTRFFDPVFTPTSAKTTRLTPTALLTSSTAQLHLNQLDVLHLVFTPTADTARISGQMADPTIPTECDVLARSFALLSSASSFENEKVGDWLWSALPNTAVQIGERRSSTNVQTEASFLSLLSHLEEIASCSDTLSSAAHNQQHFGVLGTLPYFNARFKHLTSPSPPKTFLPSSLTHPLLLSPTLVPTAPLLSSLNTRPFNFDFYNPLRDLRFFQSNNLNLLSRFLSGLDGDMRMFLSAPISPAALLRSQTLSSGQDLLTFFPLVAFPPLFTSTVSSARASLFAKVEEEGKLTAVDSERASLLRVIRIFASLNLTYVQQGDDFVMEPPLAVLFTPSQPATSSSSQPWKLNQNAAQINKNDLPVATKRLLAHQIELEQFRWKEMKVREERKEDTASATQNSQGDAKTAISSSTSAPNRHRHASDDELGIIRIQPSTNPNATAIERAIQQFNVSQIHHIGETSIISGTIDTLDCVTNVVTVKASSLPLGRYIGMPSYSNFLEYFGPNQELWSNFHAKSFWRTICFSITGVFQSVDQHLFSSTFPTGKLYKFHVLYPTHDNKREPVILHVDDNTPDIIASISNMRQAEVAEIQVQPTLVTDKHHFMQLVSIISVFTPQQLVPPTPPLPPLSASSQPMSVPNHPLPLNRSHSAVTNHPPPVFPPGSRSAHNSRPNPQWPRNMQPIVPVPHPVVYPRSSAQPSFHSAPSRVVHPTVTPPQRSPATIGAPQPNLSQQPQSSSVPMPVLQSHHHFNQNTTTSFAAQRNPYFVGHPSNPAPQNQLALTMASTQRQPLSLSFEGPLQHLSSSQSAPNRPSQTRIPENASAMLDVSWAAVPSQPRPPQDNERPYSPLIDPLSEQEEETQGLRCALTGKLITTPARLRNSEERVFFEFDAIRRFVQDNGMDPITFEQADPDDVVVDNEQLRKCQEYRRMHPRRD
ncbi:putative Chromosome transmission fidelity protein 18 [Blattamonas nauphoetae]|uniref:Chromosome transmission fidelity protein 18 n=1 Tax=Blattamonas nauphoetae TaxID=2049346 RepID=A0ABQ9WP07_9EUKA|nr:putative Chromosome transmission fidelity protein 18 [Blattamonas nauphoetae]